MSHRRFAYHEVQQLKRDAKLLRKQDQFLTQAQALDLIAVDHGYANWSLLMKNSINLEVDLVTLSSRPYPGANYPGIFLVEMELKEEQNAYWALRDNIPFPLPTAAGWLFRRAGKDQREFAPYLDFKQAVPQGVFVTGYWRAILSTNGIQPDELDHFLGNPFRSILSQIESSANQRLVSIGTDTTLGEMNGVRLFYSRRQPSGIEGIESVLLSGEDQAKQYALEDDCVRVGIRNPDGSWLGFSRTLGWTDGPAPH